jgi:hypothetical protein
MILHGQKKMYFDCYVQGALSSKQVKYEDIGDVMLYNLKNDSKNKVSVSYFECPINITKKESLQYVKKVCETHVGLWSNNTITLKRKLFKVKRVFIYSIDIKLFVENATLKVISFCEANKVFEIIYFLDSNSNYEDVVLKKLKRRECL